MMRSTTQRSLVVGTALIALAIASAAAQAQPSAKDRRVAEGTRTWARKVLAEQQRQAQVTRRVDDVTARFRILIQNLQSNGFIEESKGNELLTAIEVLGKVNEENVRQAIISLGAARKKPEEAMDHLSRADAEIETVVNDLIKLLQLADATEGDQLLREELRRVIEQEETVAEKTIQFGRDQLAGTDVLAAHAANLATTQVEVAQLAGKLNKIFEAAVEDALSEADRNRIGKAMDVFNERKVHLMLADAAGNIQDMKFIDATIQQKDALKALREVELMLAGDQSASAKNMARVLVALREILQRQQALRAETEAAEPPRFTTLRRRLQGKQREITNALSTIDVSLFEPGKIGGGAAGSTNPIRDAGLAMEQAEAAFEDMNQKHATVNQRKAEEHLLRAINAFEAGMKSANTKEMEATPAEKLSKLVILLEELLDEQIRVRTATQQQAKAKEDVAPMAVPQQNLMDRTLPITEMLEAQAVAIQKGIGMALSGMDEAIPALKQNNPAEGVPAQIRAEEGLAAALQAAKANLNEMKQAEEDAAALETLQNDLEDLIRDQQKVNDQTELAENPAEMSQAAKEQKSVAQKTPPTSPSAPSDIQADIQKAGEAMEKAAEALEEGDKETAQAEQEKATDALKKAAKNSAEAKNRKKKKGNGKKMKGPGKSKGSKGTGKASEGEGDGAATEPSGGGALPPTSFKDHTTMERAFAKGTPSGTRPADSKSDWKSLGERKQDVVSAGYIQHLPVEYRELLIDYYKTLAKEEDEE